MTPAPAPPIDEAHPVGARCNLCGGAVFGHMRRRRFVRCAGCRSLERTRLIRALLMRLRPRLAGLRALHFAPETSLAAALAAEGVRAELKDFDPAGFPDLAVNRFDLCSDLPTLEDGAYDLVIHSHVLEHLPTDPISVMAALTRKLAPGGLHVFAIPIVSGWYREDLTPTLTGQEREERFGQADHLRVFGRNDLKARFLDHLPGVRVHNPAQVTDAETLRRIRVPEPTWRQLSGNTLFTIEAAA